MRIRWAPVLWLLLISNVIAGLLYSPLTSIRRVRAEGAPRWDEERLASILEPLKGVPCAQIRAAEVESAALSDPEVRSARFDRNLFGSAVLSVGYRQPVAALAGHPNVVLARDGILYRCLHIPAGLPTIRIDAEHPSPDLTLALDWPAVEVARLALRARGLANGRSMAIELGKDGSVCLNMGAGQVDFGSCDDMDAKLAVLRRILSKDPAYLSRVKSLNLAVASAPTAVPAPVRELK